MEQILITIITVFMSAVVAGIAMYLVSLKRGDKSVSTRDSIADDNPEVVDAKTKAKEIVLEAKDSALQIKAEAEEDIRKSQRDVVELEKKLESRLSKIEDREREIDKKAKALRQMKDKIESREANIDKLYKEQQNKLEKIASLTKKEAREQLLISFDNELTQEKGRRIREMEDEIKRDIDEKARQMIVDAMRYGATDIVVEYTVSKVKLPDEDVKGRIIGKEGRNIRTFEELTGVELELDSSPGEVIVSSFDPVRREIARLSLEKLIADGRIQPSRIEEIVNKTTSEVESIMFKAGDNLCHRVGVYKLPKDLVQMLGRFKYRFSYGQNMLEHTLEETRIGIALAKELGADANVVRMGCLLHDIGKIVTDEEGSHVDLGVDLLRKYKLPKKVIDCVAEHHEDRPFSSLESAIVALVDHISGARPGARAEDYESYVKRMKDLESAAKSFDGVDKAYAISAGREVRVFVKPEVVDDASTALLAREIARKIELEQTYPGTVKVIAIRETRVAETAK
ncbi:MAG: ribonuclease Y [Patescibacteria group bacterium]